MICTCGRLAVRRGNTLCLACYERLRRAGKLAPLHVPSAEERFFAKVDADESLACWVWTGARTYGYGIFRFEKANVGAHRWSYEFLRSEIPDGLQLDHLCRNRACVNPWHLEPVTIGVNVARGESPAAVVSRTDICQNGHFRDEVGVWKNKRYCLKCRRERHAEKAADPAWRAERATYERLRNQRHEVKPTDDEAKAVEDRKLGESADAT